MKDKIKYYLLLLAFLFIMALILLSCHDWIEQYSNSLMVLITFIYVVATIEICGQISNLLKQLKNSSKNRNVSLQKMNGSK